MAGSGVVEYSVRAKYDKASSFAKDLTKEVEERLSKMRTSVMGSGFVSGLQKGVFGQGKEAPTGFMGGLGKMTGQLGLALGVFSVIKTGISGMFGILADIFPPFKMFLQLFKVIGMLLFIPLIPVMLPLFKMLGSIMPKLISVGQDLAKKGAEHPDEVGGAALIGAALGFATGGMMGSLTGLVLGAIGTEALIKAGDEVAKAMDGNAATITTKTGGQATAMDFLLGNITTTSKTFETGNIKIGDAFDTTKTGIDTKGGGVVSALGGLMDQISKIKIPSFGGGGGSPALSGFENFLQHPIQSIKNAFSGKSGQDFLLRSDGTMVNFAENDNIVGFKGGMPPVGGGGAVINISIDKPQFRSENDIKMLVREISAQLQTQFRGHSAHIGGI